MPEMTLAQMAACKVRYQTLAELHPIYKFVIHFELSPYVNRTRYTRRLNYAQMCRCQKVCTDGSCLCYLTMIYREMTDEFWNEPSDYEFLSKFVTF